MSDHYCGGCGKIVNECVCVVVTMPHCTNELDRLTRLNAELVESGKIVAGEFEQCVSEKRHLEVVQDELLDYAKHKLSCLSYSGMACDCGLAQLLEKMK